MTDSTTDLFANSSPLSSSHSEFEEAVTAPKRKLSHEHTSSSKFRKAENTARISTAGDTVGAPTEVAMAAELKKRGRALVKKESVGGTVAGTAVSSRKDAPAPKKRGRKPKAVGLSQPLLNNVLTKRDSPLVEMDLQAIAFKLINEMPLEVLQELSRLVPHVDTQEGLVNPALLKGNPHLKEQINTFQDVLSLGGFEVKKEKKPEANDDLPFKDDQYEANWGDRLGGK